MRVLGLSYAVNDDMGISVSQTVYDDENGDFEYNGGDTLVYFETELLDAVYYFQLTVSDGDLPSESADINITIIDENTPPVAEGGDYDPVDENEVVRLIATDVNSYSKSYDTTSTGQMLSYFWKPLKVNQYGASRVEWSQ